MRGDRRIIKLMRRDRRIINLMGVDRKDNSIAILSFLVF